MADTLETAENVERISELTRVRITAVSPGINTYTLSALDEICRKKELKRPEPELANLLENNFLEFESALQNDIILQKDVIKSARAVSLAEKLYNEMKSRVKLIQNSIKANSDKLLANEEEFKNQNAELHKTVEKKKNEMALDIDTMRNESRGWMFNFLSRLKQEIEAIGSTVSVSDLERHFQFFMSDLIKSAVTSCVERHQKDISDKLTDFSNDISQEITQSVFGNVDAQIAGSITDISWTKVDTTVFAIDFIGGGILGPLMIVGQTIAGFVRQSSISKKQSDFLAPILQGFGSVMNDTVNNLDSIYEQLKLSAIDKLDKLFKSQIDVSLEAIEQARQIAADEDVKAEQIVEYLDTVLQSVERNKEILNKYH
jgi:biopolymer transport protein ExbB/TolQ